MSRRMRCLCGAAGCARMVDKSQQDGGLACMSRRMRCLCGAAGWERMGDQGEAGWACMYRETQGGTLGGGLAWMSRRMRCLSGAAGWERMGDQGEAGWGLACMSGRRGVFVRLGLQDVHAWLTRGEADGGLHMVTPLHVCWM